MFIRGCGGRKKSEKFVSTEGTISVTTNITGAAVEILNGATPVATGSTIDGTFKTGKLPEGSYTVKVTKNGYEDFVKVVTVVDGDVALDVKLVEKAVQVVSVKGVDNKTVEVGFNTHVEELKAEDFVFDNGLTVTDAKFKVNDAKTVILTTSSQTKDKVYTLNYQGSNTGKTFTGIEAALQVVDVVNLNLRQVKIVFNKEVSKSSAENIANYSFNGGISLVNGKASAKLQEDKKSVVITIDNQKKQTGSYEFGNPKDYRVTVEGVTDLAGTLVQKVTKDFTAKDETLPVALSASTLKGSNAEIHVLFSEPMDSGNLGSYTVTANDVAVNSVTAALSTVDPCEVVLTCTNGFPVGELKVSYTGGAKDFAGLQALPVLLGKVVAEGQTAVTKVSDVNVEDENIALIKFSNPIAVPADNSFYWNRTGVSTDQIATNKSTKVSRVDSYTLKVEFTGTHRLPKGEDAYIFADSSVVKDTTGNAIADSKTQSFKVNAKAAAPATIVAARSVQNTGVVVTFDKVMNATEVVKNELYTILDKDGKVVEGKGTDTLGHPTGFISADSSNLSVTITGLSLDSGNYSVKITDVKDGNDNKISGTKAISVADVTAPTVKSVKAMDKVANGDYDAIYVQFSEVMDSATLVDTNNYEFNTKGAGLVKLSEDPTFVSITPVNDNKGVLIKFEQASATVEGRGYKIRFAKDIAGNPVNESTGTTTASSTPVDISAATKKTRVDGKTYKFNLPIHLSYIEKSDFTIGLNAGAMDVPEKVSYVNNDDGSSTVTVVSSSDLGLVSSVDIKTTNVAKVSKDALGLPFDQATKTLSYASIDVVSDAPVIKKAYVTAKNKIVVVFNKKVTADKDDFTVLDPSSTTPTTPIVVSSVSDSTNEVELTLSNDLTSYDALPTIKVNSLTNTQDNDGQKLAGNQTIKVENFICTNVRLVNGDGTAKTLKANDYIELSFNKAIDPSTLITDTTFGVGSAKAWDGKTDLTVPVGKLKFADGSNDAIELVGNTQFGKIDFGDTSVVSGDQTNAQPVIISLSADGKTLKIKFTGNEDLSGSVTASAISGAKYTPDANITSKDGEKINVSVEPKTVTKF